MLTLKTLRDDPQHVIEKLAVKNFDARAIVEKVLELDTNRRALQTESDAIVLHHVFLHGLVLVERRILRQVAHRVAWAPNHLTLGRLLKSCDDFHQRRFTGTVQTDDTDFFSVEER